MLGIWAEGVAGVDGTEGERGRELDFLGQATNGLPPGD